VTNEAVPESTVTTTPTNISSGALLPLPELERLVSSVKQQLEQLHRERDQLAETVNRLDSELQSQKKAGAQLQADRDKYKELARAFMEIADPLEKVIQDFEHMPPPDHCQNADDLLAEIDALRRTVKDRQPA
jgi:chromosome segregation ATPase